MIGIAKKIRLTEKPCDVLSQIVTSRTHRLDHVERAPIILLSSALKPNVQISQKLSISISTVKKWRKRWLKNEEKLLLVDEKEKAINDVRKILELLSDEQRSGAPSTFTAEQVGQIMSLACERPEDSERPISHWSLNSLMNEIINRGIVETISRSRLSVFLKSREYKTS